jgi:hypothetical protein
MSFTSKWLKSPCDLNRNRLTKCDMDSVEEMAASLQRVRRSRKKNSERQPVRCDSCTFSDLLCS